MSSVWVYQGLAQALRTPDGTLWAGTTFTLRAMATGSTGQLMALSNMAQVRVGQIVRWQWEYELPPYLTVTSGEGWFTLLVQNKGNGIDALQLGIATSEGLGTSPWQISLFEQLEPNQLFGDARPVSESTTPFMPMEHRRLFIRVRPPSDRNTDGVFLTLNMRSVVGARTLPFAEFVAGAETLIYPHTTASTWTGYSLAAPPQLLNGRLYWIAAMDSRVYFFSTTRPLNADNTFYNNIQYEAALRGIVPSGQGAVIGNRWYLMNRQGFIAYFDWTQATGGVNVSVQWLSMGGLVANPNLPMVSDGTRLYFALTNQQLGIYHPTTNGFSTLQVANPTPIRIVQRLPQGLVLVGRDGGRFDLIGSGNLVESTMMLGSADSIIGASVDEQRNTLLVACGARLGCYHLLQRQWLWSVAVDAPIVAPPVYDSTTDSVYIFTRDGWLHAFDAAIGVPSLFYPHQLIPDAPVIKAAMQVLSRADRKVPYIYLAAQLDTGDVLTTRVLQVTAVNPFNRFYSTSVMQGAVLGESLLFTGTSNRDLLLVWCWSGGDTNRGRFYGFRLR
ncbi:MAG: PQQ-binding-like beta-propeller repeat protein [Armatimonadota bacterium]